jgi:hypothetical protein
MHQLITYNSAEWPIENIERMATIFSAQAFVTDAWGVLKSTTRFDRVYLLRQGGKPEERVIFGIGEVLDDAKKVANERGGESYQALIRFTRFIDPRVGSLLDAATVRTILGDDASTRRSGWQLSDEKADALDAALANAKRQAQLRSVQ